MYVFAEITRAWPPTKCVGATWCRRMVDRAYNGKPLCWSHRAAIYDARPLNPLDVLPQIIPTLETRIDHPETENPERGDVWLECKTQEIWSMIVHLNDHHQWTREQIADWLDTLDLDLTIPIVSI